MARSRIQETKFPYEELLGGSRKNHCQRYEIAGGHTCGVRSPTDDLIGHAVYGSWFVSRVMEAEIKKKSIAGMEMVMTCESGSAG